MFTKMKTGEDHRNLIKSDFYLFDSSIIIWFYY